jgi:hypothetical protein
LIGGIMPFVEREAVFIPVLGEPPEGFTLHRQSYRWIGRRIERTGSCA